VVLFGAFDRHNFGDLLFPHLVAELLPGHTFAFAGLAERDLRGVGGHHVVPLARARHLVHAGGEILTCTAWQAAIMLLDAEAAVQTVAHYDGAPQAAAAWALETLGTGRRIPYVVGRQALAPGGTLVFNAVGGVEWAALPQASRTEVRDALLQADWLSVRDRVTQTALRSEGVEAQLCPDSAVMVEQCFGALIRQHQQRQPLKSVRDAFPQGYLACQFSTDFADDTSLDEIARGLAEVDARSGLGVVFFRAGAAPWHDDLALYAKLAERLPEGLALTFDSPHLWDICALIAGSRGVLCSSLHGRIVALAYGLPRVSLVSPQQQGRPDKLAAFADTWESAPLPRGVGITDVGPALLHVLALPASVHGEAAPRLCARYRKSQAQWAARLTP
jgi:hypothetical protein